MASSRRFKVAAASARTRVVAWASRARWVVALAALVAVVLGTSGHAAASTVAKQVLQHINVDEKLDAPLPLDTQFLDHTGKAVRLGDYFRGKRPVLLILAYHSCPVLCSMVQNAAATALKNVKWTVGKDFDVVVLSIDPHDTPARAAEKRAVIIANYARPGSDDGFHYIVGAKPEIDRVADAIGFKYEYDPEQQQFGHPAVIMFVEPTGRMARYLYGLEYDPNDVRIALFEAAAGHSISTLERVVLFCYHYDPQDGKYVVMATRIMQLGGALTVLVLGAFLSLMWRFERRRSRGLRPSSPPPPPPRAPGPRPPGGSKQ
jgi:protein SCO1/2